MASALVPLANLTLGSAQATVTFSSISGAYRDLRLVIWPNVGSGGSLWIRCNSDAASNYTQVTAYGNGSTAGSNSGTITGLFAGYNVDQMSTNDILDYSATDKHKTMLSRNNATGGAQMSASRWANTAAVTTLAVVCETGNFPIGSTFALYGVSA